MGAIKAYWRDRSAGPSSPKSQSASGTPIQSATSWTPNAATRVSPTAVASSFKNLAYFSSRIMSAARPANTMSSSSGTWVRSRPDASSFCPLMQNSPKAGDPLASAKNTHLRCCAFTGMAHCQCAWRLVSILVNRSLTVTAQVRGYQPGSRAQTEPKPSALTAPSRARLRYALLSRDREGAVAQTVNRSSNAAPRCADAAAPDARINTRPATSPAPACCYEPESTTASA